MKKIMGLLLTTFSGLSFAEGTTNTTTAATAGAVAPSAPNPLVSLAPFLVIMVIFYFLMIRPQKKKMQEEQKMLQSLGKGDEIYTKAGLIGRITGMTEKVVTVDVGDGTSLKILRSQVGGPLKTILGEGAVSQQQKE